MSLNFWMIVGVSIFLLIEVLGFSSPHGVLAATVTLFSTLFFLALFGLTAWIDSSRAESNPWVNDVEQMDWYLNPMYSSWVYVKDRLAWFRFNTVVGAALSFFVGSIASFSVWRGIVGLSDFELGLLVGLGFVIIAAVCWYKGFCMQWVAEEDQNDGQELSDDEQYENAGSTTD